MKNPLGNTEADGGVKLVMPTFLSWTAILAVMYSLYVGVTYVTDTRSMAAENAGDITLLQSDVAALKESDRRDSERLVRVEEQLKVGVDLMKRTLDKLDKIDEGKIARP